MSSVRGTSQLFTFIFDYAGGTHVSQHRGRTLDEAMRKWLAREPAKLEALVKLRFARTLADVWAKGYRPSALEAPLKHAWCWSAVLPRGLALVHIVRTFADE